LKRCFGPPYEELRPLGIVSGRQLKCPREPRFGLDGVESERSLTRKGQEPAGRRRQLLGLVCVAGGLG
jgi:hypothetical protein